MNAIFRDQDSASISGEARRLVEQQAYEEAIEWLESALLVHIESAEIYLLLGTCFKALNRMHEAELTLQTGILSLPEETCLYIELGKILRDLGEYREAIKILTEAIETDACSDQAWAHLGIVWEVSGDTLRAESAYRRAIELAPTRGLYYLCLGKLLKYTDRASASKDALREARRYMQNETDYDRACLEVVDGNPELALHYLGRYIRCNPQGKAWASRDPDLAPLHGLSAFRKMLDMEERDRSRLH